jgi:hypothetical protein
MKVENFMKESAAEEVFISCVRFDTDFRDFQKIQKRIAELSAQYHVMATGAPSPAR